MNLTILALIPTVFQIIKLIESLMPASTGKEKFDAAVASLEQVYGNLSSMMPVLTPMITGFVAMLNAAGVFHKKPTA
jgi:hypothetical protein